MGRALVRGRWAGVGAAAVVAASAAAALAITAPARDPRPPGVVTVLVARGAGPPEQATGFVAAGSRVVTVAHVLDGGGTVTVRGPGAAHGARVVRVDRAADLALLDAGALEGATVAAKGEERVVHVRGGRVEAIPITVRRRVVAHIRDSAGPRMYTRAALELAGEVAGGDSGAPVIGDGGELLGVVFARSDRDDDRAWAVDARAVAALLGD